jgi:hypothetical protein
LDDRGFALLIRLAQRYRICDHCYQNFTVQNPNVAGNRCLTCFLAGAGERHGLTYQGLYTKTEEQPKSHRWMWEEQLRTKHWFLDSEGYVHVTAAGPGYESRDSSRDIAANLEHWGFPLPVKADHNGKTADLYPGNFTSFYGDLRSDAVLVLHYWGRYQNQEFYFLSQRGGMTLQINRRKPSHRQALEEARKALPSSAHEWEVYRHLAKQLSQELAAAQPALLPEGAPPTAV